jgi:cysteine desulfurase
LTDKPTVYLDHNATTPLRPEVLDAIVPVLRGVYGNPNSVHHLGQEARKLVERARVQVAALINAASPDEIVFTSCGSESDVLAICGAAQQAYNASNGKKNHIVSSAIEHEAVRGSVRQMRARGCEATLVGCDSDARISADDVFAAIRPETSLVSIMFANNEVGALQPISEIAKFCREKGILFHTDAVQAAGKVVIDVQALGVDLLALSGHKINAPKGVGALYIRKGTRLAPVVVGHQEKNRRGGTENISGIVALGVAAECAAKDLASHAEKLTALRDRLEEGVAKIDGAHRTSRADLRLPHTSHFCFDGVDGQNLVVGLDLQGICCSSGPACSSGATELSHVLKAMQVPEKVGRGALRVSLGWGTSAADIDRLLEVLPQVLAKLRKAEQSPTESAKI